MGKVVGIQVIFLCIQGLLYLGVQKLEGPAHDVSSRLDEKIPLWTPSVLIYISWYPLLAVFPLCLYAADCEAYGLYMATMVADILFSSIVYLAYPSSFQRPVPLDTITGKILRILYWCNYTGKNCMPSMHCSMCFIIMYYAAMSMSINLGLFAAFFLLAVLIIISTLLTKQHVIIDVITALIAAILSIGAVMIIWAVV